MLGKIFIAASLVVVTYLIGFNAGKRQERDNLDHAARRSAQAAKVVAEGQAKVLRQEAEVVAEQNRRAELAKERAEMAARPQIPTVPSYPIPSGDYHDDVRERSVRRSRPSGGTAVQYNYFNHGSVWGVRQYPITTPKTVLPAPPMPKSQ